jgi:copper chaperone CopZ
MQKTYSFLLIVIIFSACQTSHPSNTVSTGSIKIAPENLTEIRFEVSGMTCTDCENTISKSVKELPGIAEIKASYLDSFALVKFDKTKTTSEAIKQAIESKGYEVKGFAESKD